MPERARRLVTKWPFAGFAHTAQKCVENSLVVMVAGNLGSPLAAEMRGCRQAQQSWIEMKTIWGINPVTLDYMTHQNQAATGTIKRNSFDGHVAIKAAPSTTTYEWAGFDPHTGFYGLSTTAVESWENVWGPGSSSTDGWVSSQPSYSSGAIKLDPETRHVAVRSAPDMPAGEWFVFDPVNGGYYAPTASVEFWLDVPIP